jgi:hypothetical protein
VGSRTLGSTVSRGPRRGRAAVASLVVAILATACGGGADEPELGSVDVLPTLARVCGDAAAALAAAPEPVDAETETAFLAVMRTTGNEVHEALRPIADAVADIDLWEFSQLANRFPEIIGRWTPDEVAWRGRALVTRLDELAGTMGASACSADRWQLDVWAAWSERLRPPAGTDASFAADVREACDATVGEYEPTSPGLPVYTGGADQAFLELSWAIDSIVPSPDRVGTLTEMLVALLSIDAAQAVSVLGPPEVGAASRVVEEVDRLVETFESIGATC